MQTFGVPNSDELYFLRWVRLEQLGPAYRRPRSRASGSQFERRPVCGVAWFPNSRSSLGGGSPQLYYPRSHQKGAGRILQKKKKATACKCQQLHCQNICKPCINSTCFIFDYQNRVLSIVRLTCAIHRKATQPPNRLGR